MVPASANSPYSNGRAVASPSTKRDVRGRTLAPGGEQLRRLVDPDDLVDVRRERERERAGAAAGVEGALVTGERREQLHDVLLERRRPLLLVRQP